MVKEWKGSKKDIFVTYGIYLLFVTLVHIYICSSAQHAHRVNKQMFEDLFNIWHFLGVLFLVSLFMLSPVWIYIRKVPKSISIDTSNLKLTIKRRVRMKSPIFDLNSISYAYYTTSMFSVIEIYGPFTSSRGQILEKRLSTIVVHNKGMSWNQKVFEEIVETLDELKVPSRSSNPRNFWEYIYDK